MAKWGTLEISDEVSAALDALANMPTNKPGETVRDLLADLNRGEALRSWCARCGHSPKGTEAADPCPKCGVAQT